MKKTAIALALMAATTLVQAQSKEFEGFSAGFGVSSVGANTKITGQDSGNFIDMGKTSVVPSVDFSYAYVLDSKWLMGVGLSYDLSKTKSGGAQLADGVDTETIKFEGKNHYSIYLQPTYALSNTTAIFGKIGYHSLKGTETYSHTTDDGYSVSSRFKGIGYGVGIKTFIDKNVYIQAEAQLIDFKSKTVSYEDASSVVYKTKSTVGTVSVGYRF